MHSSSLVTHRMAQASFCASSPDASPATPGPERYFPAPGSSFGSPLWPAIGTGWSVLRPCDTLASHSGAGGHDYENLEGTTLYNADTCTLHFASLADYNSAPEAQRNPTTPIKKSPAQDLKNPKNNTQEEESCPEAFEEDLRSTERDFQTGRFTRFSNRRWHKPRLTKNHAEMAGANKGKTSEDVTKEERAVGKITNFGFLYGQAPKGFMSFARKEGIELTFEAGQRLPLQLLQDLPRHQALALRVLESRPKSEDEERPDGNGPPSLASQGYRMGAIQHVH